MRTIEPFQIRKIFAIGSALGIKGSGTDNDELHALVAGVTGKDSIKSLTYREASEVIARLEGLQGKVAPYRPKAGKPKEHPERSGGVTSGQQKKIWALMYELKKYDEVPNDVPLGDRLCAVIKKELGADAVARNPFAWVTFKQGNDLIEKLKRYVASAGKRGGADGLAGQGTDR
ncbi:MAG: regulatory protein GemA [Ruminococcus sp.]|nr:regulatory protein GemA [Ruminococcus sp.]